MRKFLTGVLAAITVICAAFGLAGCGKKHNNGNNGYDPDKEREQELAASKAVIAEAISSVPSYLKGGNVIIGYKIDNSDDKSFYFAADEDSVITFSPSGYDTGYPVYDTEFFADYISSALGVDDKGYDFTAHNTKIANINGEYYTFYGEPDEQDGKYYGMRNYYTTEDQFVAAGKVYNFLSGDEFLPLFDINSYSFCSVDAELQNEFHNGTANHDEEFAMLEATNLTVNGKTIETVSVYISLDSVRITFITGERSSEVTIPFPGNSEYIEKIWGFASYELGGEGMEYNDMSYVAEKIKTEWTVSDREPVFFYITRDKMPDLKNGNYRVTINKTIKYNLYSENEIYRFRNVTEVYENDNGKVKKTVDGTDTYFDFVSDKVYETFEGKTYYYTLASSDGVIERPLVEDSIYLSDEFINKIYNFDRANVTWDGYVGQMNMNWFGTYSTVKLTATDSSFTFSYYNTSAGVGLYENCEITFDKIGECSVTVPDGDEMTLADVLDRIEKTDVYTTSNAGHYKGTVGYVVYNGTRVACRKINGKNYFRDSGKYIAYKADDSFYNTLSVKNNILYSPFFDVNNYKKTSDGYSFDCDLYNGTAKLVANKIVLDITEVKFDTSLPGTYYSSGSNFIRDMDSYSLTYAESIYDYRNYYYSSYYNEELINSAEDYSASETFNLVAAKFNDLNYRFFGSGKYDGAVYGTNNKLMFPSFGGSENDESTLLAFYAKDGKLYSRVLIDYSSYNSLNWKDKDVLKKYLGAEDEYVRRNGKFIVDKLANPSESGYKIGAFNPVVNGDPLSDLFGYLGTSEKNIQMLSLGVFAIKTDDGIKVISTKDDEVSLQGVGSFSGIGKVRKNVVVPNPYDKTADVTLGTLGDTITALKANNYDMVSDDGTVTSFDGDNRIIDGVVYIKNSDGGYDSYTKTLGSDGILTVINGTVESLPENSVSRFIEGVLDEYDSGSATEYYNGIKAFVSGGNANYWVEVILFGGLRITVSNSNECYNYEFENTGEVNIVPVTAEDKLTLFRETIQEYKNYSQRVTLYQINQDGSEAMASYYEEYANKSAVYRENGDSAGNVVKTAARASEEDGKNVVYTYDYSANKWVKSGEGAFSVVWDDTANDYFDESKCVKVSEGKYTLAAAKYRVGYRLYDVKNITINLNGNSYSFTGYIYDDYGNAYAKITLGFFNVNDTTPNIPA